MIFIAILFLIFWRVSTNLPPKPICEEIFRDWFDVCMAEFDENPRKSGELGLIQVTPMIDLLLDAGGKHSNLPLSAEDKIALRNYCVVRTMDRIERFGNECR